MDKVETSVDLFTAESIQLQGIVKRFAENNGYEKCHSVYLKVQKCINKGEDAVKQMELLVKQTNSLHKIMAVTKVGGTLASFGGSVSVAGGILLGITGGFGALVVAGIVVGGGLFTTGISTTSGSSLIEATSIEQKRKRVNKYLEKYSDAVQELKESWKHLEQLCEEISIEEDTSVPSLLLFLWSNFIKFKSEYNCNEAFISLKNFVTSIPSAVYENYLQIFEFFGNILLYAAIQIPDSYRILFDGQRHTIAQEVEDIHLPSLRRQIDQLKATRNELARASQK